MDAAATHDPFERFLHEERWRSARRIALLRFVSAVAVAALTTPFRWTNPTFIGPPPEILGPYALIAALVLAFRRRTDRLLWVDGIVIPLVDVPVVFAIFQITIELLLATESSADAIRLPYMACAFFAQMILFSSILLVPWQVGVTAVVTLALQVVLVGITDPGQYYLVGQCAISLLLATALGWFSCHRTLRLVRGFADEQLRKERLGRYFSPQIVDRLEHGQDGFGAGQSFEVTILFIDLRDFTSLGERLESHAVVEVLNQFHGRMVDCLFGFGGTLDKYLGDGLMAYFGAPIPQDDHAERAVRCALAMQGALDEWNLSGSHPYVFRLGIGIHSGRVVLGDIGAPQRREFTAIGDPVNVASRIEQLTKQYAVPILVSDETRRRIAVENLDFESLGSAQVRGKSEPIEVFAPFAVVTRPGATAEPR